MKFATHTLGCKVNQVEVEKITDDLVKNGYTFQTSSDEADFLIINTCTVTEKADHKSLRTIRRFSKKSNLKKIFITGCYSELEKDLKNKISEKNIIVTQKNKMKIPGLVDQEMAKHFEFDISTNQEGSTQPLNREGNDRWDAYKQSRNFIGSLENQQDNFYQHTRAFIKIQDGCNYFCSYCRIPFARGAPVSRDFNDILFQVKNLDQNRIPEIVLTGINLGTYHYKSSKINFGELVRCILENLTHSKLRISSIEPFSLDDTFFQQLGHPRLTPHIHLALQGTTDRILKEMNRRYTRDEFLSILDRFYQSREHFSVSTDVIVGFDDETDREFEEGIDYLKKCRFSKLHVFPFSNRPYSEYHNKQRERALPKKQVSETAKQKRAKTLRNLSNQLYREFNHATLYYPQKFIVEEELNFKDDPELISKLPADVIKGENVRLLKGTSDFYQKGLLVLHEKNEPNSIESQNQYQVSLTSQNDDTLIFKSS